MKTSKSILREKYRLKREALSEEEIENLSLEIANQTLKLKIWSATYYHLFLSIAGKKEVNTEYLLQILQGRDKSVVLSKSDFSSGGMKHFLLQENTVLKTSSYGIPEPVAGIEISPELLEVIFVPLLAFDGAGHRIGYGKGFYDRFLQRCKPETVLIGLSFFGPEEELIETYPTDIPLHYCVTPTEIFSF